MMMQTPIHRSLLCISLILCQTSMLQAFQATSSGIIQNARLSTSNTRWTLHTLKMSDDREDEIAKLEEKLRKLREEATQDDGDQQSEAASVTDVNGADVNGVSTSSEESEAVVPEAMFLSEGWKEGDGAELEEGSGTIKTVLSAIGFAVFLAVFSQIPIGQEDYSKYSAVKAQTEKIDLGDLNRARQTGDL